MPRLLLRRSLFLALTLVFSACGGGGCNSDTPTSRLALIGPESLVALSIEAPEIADGDSLAEARTAFQTDGRGAAWIDGLTGPTPGMGLTVGGERVLDAWQWYVDRDSVTYGPEARAGGIARPDFTVRSYAPPDTASVLDKALAMVQRRIVTDLSERVTMLDGRGALLVEIADSVGTVAYRPLSDDRREASGYTVRKDGGALLFARTDRTSDSTGVAVWTAVVADGGEVRASVASSLPVGEDEAPVFALGELALPTPGRLVVATGKTPAQAVAAARAALGQADALRDARSARMAALLDDFAFRTDDDRATRAVRWAMLSLDALVVQADSGRSVLMPGLPGMEPVAPRATIETNTAFLNAGQWETARDLLLTTARAQVFDRRLNALGRAPDVVRPDGEPVFATAEATPLFLTAAGDLVRTAGERGLVSSGPNFWFKTVFALRGIYERDRRNGNQTDTLAFLVTNAKRGTAFDGDPAARGIVRQGAPAEAQGALVGALRTAADFSRVMGVSQRSTAKWYADTSVVLVRRFEEAYGRGGVLADRLDADQQPLPDVRPGGLLALARMQGAMPDAKRAQLARPLAERLVFPYGVGSLAQSDSLFYPYLSGGGLYPETVARTEGAVWTSLAGPIVALMAQTGGAVPASELFDAQADLLISRGTLGAIPELTDGHPREADAPVGVGGAPVDPWSLAGMLNAAVEGFAGVRHASPDTLVVAPHLPEAWGETRLRVRLGGGSVMLYLTQSERGLRASVAPRGNLPRGAVLRLRAGTSEALISLATVTGDTLAVARDSFAVEIDGASVTVDGERTEARTVAAPPDAWDGFSFATPDIRSEYPVMRARADRRSLGARQVRRDNAGAAVALTETDPEGDDWGSTSTYTYPEGLTPGSLDVVYMEVARDDSSTYIRAEFSGLSPTPRTIVAIALDTEDGGSRDVGRNARYRFPEDEAFDYVIFVGDDLVVEDSRGNELGRIDGAGVFDADRGALSFALPTYILPRLPRGAKVTFLVGALAPGDAFMDVRRGDATSGEAGGRVDTSSPNVFDVVVGTVR